MKQYLINRSVKLASRLCLLLLFTVPLANAAPEDLTLPCTGGSVYTFTIENGSTVNEDIFAVPAIAGNVFWELVSSDPGCTVTNSPLGQPESYTCANGLNIVLPSNAPDDSVASAEPVLLTANPVNGLGSTLFSLTATLADGIGATTCQKFIEVDVVEPQVPFDIVFVLDRSGSMTSNTSAGISRWQALKDGVENFLTTTAATSCSGSRFGLTLFATTDLANSSYPETLQDIGAGLASDVMAELNHVNNNPPSGWTAMGQGLQDGISKFDDDTRTRVVMLFSDGAQNRSPMVLVGGTSYEDGPDPGTDPDPLAPGGTGLFKVITIGIDSANAAYHAILQDIQSANNGNFYSTDMGTDITVSLETAIDAVLNTCSAQTVAKYSGTLSGPTVLPAFNINRKVEQLLLRLSVNHTLKREQMNELLSMLRVQKDGTDISGFFEHIISGDSTSTALLRTNFHRPYPDSGSIDSNGSYVVSLNRPSATPLPKDLTYRLVPYSDDHRLDMKWEINPAAPRVDEPFSPQITLTWLGKPVTNATVEAVILKPGDDLGDLLARNPLTVDPTSADDADSPGGQKYARLKKDPEFLASLLPAEQRISLTHQGEGRYSGSFNPGDVSGIYQVIFFVTAEDESFGRIQRLVSESVYTRFGDIDMDNSSVSATVRPPTGAKPGGITINIRPIASNGRFIGPAQGNAFTVSGMVIDNVIDKQDGSYILVLNGHPDAEISLGILGDEIYKGPASDIGAISMLDKICKWFNRLGLPCWLGWVLITIIIIIMMIYLMVIRSNHS